MVESLIVNIVGPSYITNVGVSVDSMAEGLDIESSFIVYDGFEVGETALSD
jgi:hypothetical protein